MKIAALYDIHGNLPALEVVLQEIDTLNVDQIIVGGDVILGPMSRECLDTLLSFPIPTQFILGNCEVAVLAAMDGKALGKLPAPVLENIRWTADQLLPMHQALLAQWPKTLHIEIEGFGKVLFCHATPRNETENFTRLTPVEKLLPLFENVDADLVICGHTHMQFDIMIGKTQVVNAGSIGMPFADPGAYWLLLDSNIELHHTTYNTLEAAKRIQATDYPQAKDFANQNVITPPSEDKMLEILS